MQVLYPFSAQYMNKLLIWVSFSEIFGKGEKLQHVDEQENCKLTGILWGEGALLIGHLACILYKILYLICVHLVVVDITADKSHPECKPHMTMIASFWDKVMWKVSHLYWLACLTGWHLIYSAGMILLATCRCVNAQSAWLAEREPCLPALCECSIIIGLLPQPGTLAGFPF